MRRDGYFLAALAQSQNELSTGLIARSQVACDFAGILLVALPQGELYA